MTGRYFSGDKESFRLDCAFKLQKFRYIIVLLFLIHMHRIFFSQQSVSLIKKIFQV